MSELLDRFLESRRILIQEREQIVSRMDRIEEALRIGERPPLPPMEEIPLPPPPLPSRKAWRREAPPAPEEDPAPDPAPSGPRNTMTLKEAVLKVLEEKPLGKKEILEGVLALGYRFRTDSPENTLNTVLYNKKHFSRDKGLFGPA